MQSENTQLIEVVTEIVRKEMDKKLVEIQQTFYIHISEMSDTINETFYNIKLDIDYIRKNNNNENISDMQIQTIKPNFDEKEELQNNELQEKMKELQEKINSSNKLLRTLLDNYTGWLEQQNGRDYSYLINGKYSGMMKIDDKIIIETLPALGFTKNKDTKLCSYDDVLRISKTKPDDLEYAKPEYYCNFDSFYANTYNYTKDDIVKSQMTIWELDEYFLTKFQQLNNSCVKYYFTQTESHQPFYPVICSDNIDVHAFVTYVKNGISFGKYPPQSHIRIGKKATNNNSAGSSNVYICEDNVVSCVCERVVSFENRGYTINRKIMFCIDNLFTKRDHKNTKIVGSWIWSRDPEDNSI